MCVVLRCCQSVKIYRQQEVVVEGDDSLFRPVVVWGLDIEEALGAALRVITEVEEVDSTCPHEVGVHPTAVDLGEEEEE
jgi:hypothetical protein